MKIKTFETFKHMIRRNFCSDTYALINFSLPFGIVILNDINRYWLNKVQL